MTTADQSTDLLVLDEAARRLLFTEARTANTFSAEPVSAEQLRAITELAKWPPTAANSNPLRITFVTTPEGKARLVPLMSEGNRDKTAAAPVTAILATDLDFHEKLPELAPFRPQMRDAFATNPARPDVARLNGALQSAYFILAVRAAGLAAGPMGGFDAAGVEAEFFADRPYKALVVVNVGYPGTDPWFDRLPRLNHEDYVTYV